jgi:hypothetical protein
MPKLHRLIMPIQKAWHQEVHEFKNLRITTWPRRQLGTPHATTVLLKLTSVNFVTSIDVYNEVSTKSLTNKVLKAWSDVRRNKSIRFEKACLLSLDASHKNKKQTCP